MNLSSLVELQRNKLGSIRNTCITDVFDNKMDERKDPQRTPDNTSNGCKETLLWLMFTT